MHSGVSAVTVTATASDPRATVKVLSSLGEESAPGRVRALFRVRAGSNRFGVEVIGEDGNAFAYYPINVIVPADADLSLSDVPVRTINWDGFTAGLPTDTNAGLAKDWMMTTLKYGLNHWWTTFKKFKEQSATGPLNLDSGRSKNNGNDEFRVRDVASFALALAVALRTGAYDPSVTGVTTAVAKSRAVRLVSSLLYWHEVNVPETAATDNSRWGYHWQSGMWAGLTGSAGWMLWDDLTSVDRERLKKMVEAEANQYRGPLYYRDSSGILRYSGDSKVEEQAWNASIMSLAAIMMPTHPDAPTWRTGSIHMMLSAFARPEDALSSVVYHGHPLSDWLNGSNIYADGATINHKRLHPDYAASGTVEFNSVPLHLLANENPPEAALFNADRVMEYVVEHEYVVGTRPYPDYGRSIEPPGGTIFRPGTNCFILEEGFDRDICILAAGEKDETFHVGQDLTCLPGPPGTDSNVYYPQGSDWSKLRRPNLANFVAQAEAFSFDSRIEDPNLSASYWFGCFVRDVRAMQARHSNGATWKDSELPYALKEGQSAHYGSKAYLSYWLQHQRGSIPVTYDTASHPLEFNMIATIEAEDSDNILHGTAVKQIEPYSMSADGFLIWSGRYTVHLKGTGPANGLTITGVNAPRSGVRRCLYSC